MIAWSVYTEVSGRCIIIGSQRYAIRWPEKFTMIPIDTIQATARTLMEKAAIEIPEDYLEGIKRAADTENGDLSSFVLQAMLENYEAAKEDRRAMCGDTGTPRWYVKMGNEAQVEGGQLDAGAQARSADGIDGDAGQLHCLGATRSG